MLLLMARPAGNAPNAEAERASLAPLAGAASVCEPAIRPPWAGSKRIYLARSANPGNKLGIHARAQRMQVKCRTDPRTVASDAVIFRPDLLVAGGWPKRKGSLLNANHGNDVRQCITS